MPGKNPDSKQTEYKDAFLFFWTGQFMYIGKAVDTAIHAHHALQIAISFEAPIDVILPDASYKFKGVLIDSDQPHECRTYDNTFLILNIAPESKIGLGLKKKYLSSQTVIELPDTQVSTFSQKLKTALKEKNNSNEIFLLTQDFLHNLSDTIETSVYDNRVVKILEELNRQNSSVITVNELAEKVFISPARLIHLFTAQVGIPIRKYILWSKLLVAVQKILETKNITESALYAGFSDAPHFNKTFRRMFGINPSTLIKNSQIVQAYRE